MNSIPVAGLGSLSPLGQVGLSGNVNSSSKTGVPFQDVLKSAIENVEELNAVKEQDNYNLAVGDVDDLGELMINAQKAEVALQLMIEMRNKFLDAYSEIMRMNV